MKAKAKLQHCLGAFAFAALVLLVCTLSPKEVRAQAACFLGNPFGSYSEIHQIGHPRSGGARRHKGADVMMCQGVQVPLPSIAMGPNMEGQPCRIIPNSEGNPIHNGQCGYGLYMRFDCGNNIEVRYAHLNGYNGNTQLAINGRTGASWTTGSHVHWEIYIDGHAVEPTCAVGMERDKIACRSTIPGGGVNVCDPYIRNQLKEDAKDKLLRDMYPHTRGARATDPMTGTAYRQGQDPNSFMQAQYGNPCEITKCGEPQCVKPNPQDPKKCPEGEAPDQPGQDHNHHGDLSGPDFEWDTISVPEGTGVVIDGGGQGTPGDAGGEITQGTDHPPADIPPMEDYDGEETTSCAVDTWVAMTNQSVMEARRETAMQRRFIAKSDSVIEYGCMAMYLKKTENEVAAIFSENDQWVNRKVDIIGKEVTMNKTLGAMSMDSALINVVWAAHESYKKNFTHPLMGGLEGYAETPNGESCKDMQKVWEAARCQNFPASSEAFPKFTDLIGNDPRKFPTDMCKNTGITQSMIDAAKNKATRFDAVAPKLDYLDPPEEDCKGPIPTGVTVYKSVAGSGGEGGYVGDTKDYADAICPNAGCRYENPDAEGAGKCVKDGGSGANNQGATPVAPWTDF